MIRFRTGTFAIQADCKAAFHQIKVPDEDQPYLQFLWEAETYTWRFLPYGLTCSPYNPHVAVDFILKRVEKTHPELVSRLREGCYVDDVTGSFDTEAEARQGIETTIKIFAEGGLTLHKTRVTGDEGDPQSLLGLKWDSKSDEIAVVLNGEIDLPTTRRSLQSMVSSIWDPLGFIAPWIVTGKLQIQQSFIAGGSWDDPLPESIQKEVNFFVSEFNQNCNQPIVLARSFANKEFILEIFCDASISAYAAIVYATDPKTGNRTLILAKSRLAPVRQKLSIPRMELMASLIGIRLAKTILSALSSRSNIKPSEVRYYSDSKDVLYWLQRNKPQKIFVKNRVEEILLQSSIHDWFYIPSALNPADLATRPCSLSKLKQSSLWWNGPDVKENELTPFCRLSKEPSSTAVAEESQTVELVNVNLNKVDNQENPDDTLFISMEKYSRLKTLINVTAYLFRLCASSMMSLVKCDDGGKSIFGDSLFRG